MEKEKQDDFWAYTVGICCMSVCSSLEPKEIIVRANQEHPTGILSNWDISEDKKFASGEEMPCVCNENPKTHKHWLLNC